MRVYFSSPGNQLHAHLVNGLDVLLSYATKSKWVEQYVPSFRRILVDSGAFSVMNSGASVSVDEYAEWAARYEEHADAIAGLDSIDGDWRQSLRNYETMPLAFPTFHDTDPPELLDDLVAMAKERKTWLGIGLKPPRHGKEDFVREVCERVPDDLHIHGWALGGLYGHIRRIDSVDSTTAWRVAMAYRVNPSLAHLTYAECCDIAVKKIVRAGRALDTKQDLLFS